MFKINNLRHKKVDYAKDWIFGEHI